MATLVGGGYLTYVSFTQPLGPTPIIFLNTMLPSAAVAVGLGLLIRGATLARRGRGRGSRIVVDGQRDRVRSSNATRSQKSHRDLDHVRRLIIVPNVATRIRDGQPTLLADCGHTDEPLVLAYHESVDALREAAAAILNAMAEARGQQEHPKAIERDIDECDIEFVEQPETSVASVVETEDGLVIELGPLSESCQQEQIIYQVVVAVLGLGMTGLVLGGLITVAPALAILLALCTLATTLYILAAGGRRLRASDRVEIGLDRVTLTERVDGHVRTGREVVENETKIDRQASIAGAWAVCFRDRELLSRTYFAGRDRAEIEWLAALLRQRFGRPPQHTIGETLRNFWAGK